MLFRRESEAAAKTAEATIMQAALHGSDAVLRAAEAASQALRRTPEASDAAMMKELQALRGGDEELRKISIIVFRVCAFSREHDRNLSRARTRCIIILGCIR